MSKTHSFMTEARISSDIEGRDHLVSTRVTINGNGILIKPESENANGWLVEGEWEAIKDFIDNNINRGEKLNVPLTEGQKNDKSK